jgi:hypothetical protein
MLVLFGGMLVSSKLRLMLVVLLLTNNFICINQLVYNKV